MRSFSSDRLPSDARGKNATRPIPWRPGGPGRGQRLATGSCSPAATVFGWVFFVGLLVVALGMCSNGVASQDEAELPVYPSLFARDARAYED